MPLWSSFRVPTKESDTWTPTVSEIAAQKLWIELKQLSFMTWRLSLGLAHSDRLLQPRCKLRSMGAPAPDACGSDGLGSLEQAYHSLVF